jgi:hypothetical protein
MLRFALGFFIGLSMPPGWVAAHPPPAHALAAGEHAVGELLLRLVTGALHASGAQ